MADIQANLPSGGSGSGSLATKLGGFVAGAFLCFTLGGMAKIIYSGEGFSDTKAPPAQVYTNF